VTETKTVEALVSLGDRYLGRVPAFEADRPWWAEIEATTAHLDQLLGVQTLVLRLLHADEAETRRGGRVVYHVQVAEEPRPGVLDPTPLPEWAEIVKPHPFRASWAEVDGPRRLIEWAQEIVGPSRPAQVKTWNLSCLIRFSTPDGGAWAKANSPFCSIDADVIRHVQQYDAQLAPGVLGMDADRRWSLLEHAPGVDCWEPDDETLRDVIGRWVTVQATIDPTELRTPRMLPQSVAAEVGELLDGEAGSQLPADVLAKARRLVDVLPGLVATLESSGLPNTLVHGDFHPGNWRSDGTTRRIVDWADSYLGHPATDLHRLSGYLPPAQRELARSTWIAAWRKHLPASDPARALPPIAVVSRLLGAITYQRFLDNIEPDERIYHEGDPAHEITGAVGTATELGLL
jgi:hypothetical protein